MGKPTAQELWEIIPLRILACVRASIQTHNCANEVEAIKESIQLYAQAYHEEQIKEKKERLLLCVETSICDCGEPYSNTDIHDLIKEL